MNHPKSVSLVQDEEPTVTYESARQPLSERTLQMTRVVVPMFSERELTPGAMFERDALYIDSALSLTLEVRGILALRYRARLQRSRSDLLLDARCRLAKEFFAGRFGYRLGHVHERFKIQSFAFSGGLVTE